MPVAIRAISGRSDNGSIFAALIVLLPTDDEMAAHRAYLDALDREGLPFSVEASAFHGAEPDENRWNLEAGALASVTSIRFSIVSGGVACVAGCLLLAAAFPALLRYDSRANADA